MVRSKIHHLVIARMKAIQNAEFDVLPILKIGDKHIRMTRLLANRKELLKCLDKNGVIAELGVDVGSFSQDILKISSPKKLHLVDFWGTKRYGEDKRKKVLDRFQAEVKSEQVEINIGLSTQVVEQFPNSYFDWIYIDTDHSYETTKSELEAYRQKMKPNGIIAGHDFIVGNWKGMVLYGVIQAVYEFCIKYDWEIVYLTMEVDIPPSFAIRKMEIA